MKTNFNSIKAALVGVVALITFTSSIFAQGAPDQSADRQIAQIRNAIARYLADNSVVPDSLKNLVPKYLDEVPTGNWDYNRNTGEVWPKGYSLSEEVSRRNTGEKSKALINQDETGRAPIFGYAGIDIRCNVALLKTKFPKSTQYMVEDGLYLVYVSDEDSVENVHHVQLGIGATGKKQVKLNLVDRSGVAPACQLILGKFEKAFGRFQKSEKVWVTERELNLQKKWFKDGEGLTLECDERGQKAYGIVIE